MGSAKARNLARIMGVVSVNGKNSKADLFVVVGLGNPGEKYARTRHNFGHLVIAELAQRLDAPLSAHRQSNTHASTARIGGQPGELGTQIVLATSNSYMNTSGGPVSSLLRYFHGDPENLIVIHDDLDLDFGVLRLKRGGGEGGHNGLKSISAALGTRSYIRMRCGIGRPPGRQDPADFVLSSFNARERAELGVLVGEAADAVRDVIEHGLEAATMRLHTANRASGRAGK